MKDNQNQLINDKINQIIDKPDDLVWINIEKELDKKKKRRFFIFWFFFIALSSFFGIYFFNFNENLKKPILENYDDSISNKNIEKNNLSAPDSLDNNIVTSKKGVGKNNEKFKNNFNLNQKNEISNTVNYKNQAQNFDNFTQKKSKVKSKSRQLNKVFKSKSINNVSSTIQKTKQIKNKSAQSLEQVDTAFAMEKANNDISIAKNESFNDFKTENKQENKTIATEKTKNKKTKKIVEKLLQETNNDTLVDRDGRRFVLIPYIGFTNMAFQNQYSLLSNDIEYQKPIPKINIQFGVRTRIELAEDLSLSVGFGYNKYVSESSIDYNPNFIWDNNVNNFIEIPYTSNILEIKQDITYISLPINVEYSIFENKNSEIKTFLGPEFNYLYENNLFYKKDNDWIEFANAAFLNKAMVNLRTGFIIRKNLSKDWIIELNPELRIPFYMKRKDYNAKPFFYGITIGTEFRF